MWLWHCIVKHLQLTSLLLFDATLWDAIFRGTSLIWSFLFVFFLSCEQFEEG